MRRTDKALLDAGELLGILDRARVCRVAMSDEGRPYLVPLSFALDGDDLVLHSAHEGRKLDILRRNPAVCFEVEEGVAIDVGPTPCDTGMSFSTVIGFGIAEFVEEATERTRLLALFGPRYGAPDVPLTGGDVRRTTVLRIRVTELTGKRDRG